MQTPPSARAPWRLRPLNVIGVSDVLDVPAEGLVFGRDPSCDVVLAADVYGTVSMRHARLVPQGDALVLEDLHSTNGTLVVGARIERSPLQHGVIFQLGLGGPRFAVLAPRVGARAHGAPVSGLARTAFATREGGAAGAPDAAPAEAVASTGVQRAGAEVAVAHASAPAESARHARAPWIAIGVALVVVAVTLAVVGRAEARRTRAAAASLERSIDERLASSRGAIEAQRESWQRQREEFERARLAWEGTRGDLEATRDALEQRLGSLESSGATSADLAALEHELESARAELQRYDPAALERSRVEELERVGRAVVLVETREVLVEPASGRVLHVVETSGTAEFNLEGQGAEFARESTGSGLCISLDGHVLTNAHVVTGDVTGAAAKVLTEHGWLERQNRVDVVFSGTGRRHAAALVALVHDERHDLALLKLEPFEGMPCVDGLDLDVEVPPRGTEVYALGFPLGKRVLQQGDTVIASAFRGIVSRTVEPFVQVDAAVHPGASGGPVIDAHGRVVGLVTAMQSADPRASSSQIGYMLPIERARAVWPPRAGDGR